MSFTLEVDFSGLCMYVVNPDTGKVTVLMPDCRMRTHTADVFHADGQRAVHHVGYVRINLADLGVPLTLTPPAVTSDAAGEPRYELVHRFDRQVLHFVEAAAPAPLAGSGTTAAAPVVDTEATTPDPVVHTDVTTTDPMVHAAAAATPVVHTGMSIPDFGKFAPGLVPIDGLFTNDPPDILLMRSELDGGTLDGRSLTNDPPTWVFSQFLNPGGEPYGGEFASYLTWRRPCEGNTLTLRITDFAGAPEAEFTLGPVPEGGTLHLDVANLCSNNPLEWSDLKTRKVLGNDEDFKWLYRLLKPAAGGTFADILLNTPLPHPARVPGLAGETGDDDCMGATMTYPPKQPAG
jgi:hypothetical protein